MVTIRKKIIIVPNDDGEKLSHSYIYFLLNVTLLLHNESDVLLQNAGRVNGLPSCSAFPRYWQLFLILFINF